MSREAKCQTWVFSLGNVEVEEINQTLATPDVVCCLEEAPKCQVQ